VRRRPGGQGAAVVLWANFWHYPHNTPTLETDADNGDEMIVRDLRLKQADGRYHLVSAPTSALENRVKRTRLLGDIVVRGTRDVDVRAAVYDLTCELMWDPASAPANLGLELCRAPGWRPARLQASKCSSETDEWCTHTGYSPLKETTESAFTPMKEPPLSGT